MSNALQSMRSVARGHTDVGTRGWLAQDFMDSLKDPITTLGEQTQANPVSVRTGK